MTHLKRALIAIPGMIVLPLLILHLASRDGITPSQDPVIPLRASEDYSRSVLAPEHPELFAEVHYQIRASENGRIEYPVGYKIHEFNKALVASKRYAGNTLNWVERGPGNVAGRTRPIVVDPDDPDYHTWFIGTAGGGAFWTTNRGYAWSYLTDNLPNLAVSALEMAESNRDIMYMGTGEGFGNIDAVDGSGIFKSYDRGQTWEHLLSTADTLFRYVNRLAIDPSDANIVLAATGEGIFRTVDGGMTWSPVHLEGTAVEDLKAQPGNFRTMIASENSGSILHSTDGGQTWAIAMSNDEMIFGGGRIELAYSPSHPAIAYGSVETSGGGAELVRSDDGGASWNNSSEINPGFFGPVNFLGGQGWYNNSIAVHPFAPDTVLLGGVFIFKAAIGEDTVNVSAVTDFEFLAEDEDFSVSYVQGLGNAIGAGIVLVGSLVDSVFTDIAQPHNASVEIRIGQGTQMAHRFFSDDSLYSGVECFLEPPYSRNEYQDYIEVPFTVWDIDSGRQLAVSFRDTANDSTFNLINFTLNGPCDAVSNEQVFIHRYDYDASSPHDSIAQDGGVTKGMMYMVLPVLAANAPSWDPSNVPEQTTTIKYTRAQGLWGREMEFQVEAANSVHVDHHAIVTLGMDEASNDFWILNTNDGGVAISTDGGGSYYETDFRFAGQNTAQFYGVDKRPGTPQYIGGTQDNGSWMSYGNPNNRRGWVSLIGADGFEAIWHQGDQDKMLVTSQFNALFYTTNRGTEWDLSFDLWLIDPGIFITSIDNSPYAEDTVYMLGQSGVIVSHDFGQSGSVTEIDTLWWPTNIGKVRASLATDTVVWAGYGLDDANSADGANNFANQDRRLWYSTNAGETFSPSGLPAMSNPPSTIISGLATHPTQAGTAFALFSRPQRPKILETTDFGETWTDLSGFSESTDGTSTRGFPDVAVYDLLVMPHAPHVIWVGTDIGIFKSKSYGNEWNYAHNGLPAASVWRMKYRDDEIVVATHGRGVWTVPWSEIDVSVEDRYAPEVPGSFSLAQNYPNPFNPTTTINFSLPEEAKIRLTVFDVIGRRVAVLTDQVYQSGVHELVWDASGHASGVYFYRMEAEGKLIQTQKMTLIK